MDIKKNMVLMNEQIGSLNRERNSKKKNTEILELKITMIEIKIGNQR